MNSTDYVTILLEQDFVIPPFNCGDEDLNDFLIRDANDYQNERFAVSHLLVPKGDNSKVAGYFCLLTDKIVFDLADETQRKAWKTFNKQNRIHFKKHRKTYPSIKLGRLAVDTSFAGQGLGRFLINRIIYIILNMKDIGCRFITVDAYKSAFDFYLKNDFQFLSSDDEDDETRVMYLDIKRFTL